MTSSRSFAWIGLAASFAWIMAGGCSSSADDGAGALNNAFGGTAGSGGRAGGPTVLEPDASVNGGRGNGSLDALCGEGTCIPDDADACASYEPPADGAGGLGGAENSAPSTGGQGGEGGATTDIGGEGGAPLGGAGGASGAASSAGAAGSGGEGGASSMNPPPPAAYSCQVARAGNLLSRECARAGTGAVNAPCFSAADCAPSLACVTEGDTGRCLPYCCGVDANCEGGTYCAVRPLRKAPTDTSASEPASVPVCVPTDDCSLEDPYPCPAGVECRCKGTKACMVVRKDGATTCLEPGAGQQGDVCPCAWNHVCSSVTERCVKICRTDSATNECGEQKCQASAELPPNFGVCVGPVK